MSIFNEMEDDFRVAGALLLVTRFTLTFVEQLYGDTRGRDLAARSRQLLRVESNMAFPCIRVGDVIDASSWGAGSGRTLFRVVNVETMLSPEGRCHNTTVFVNVSHPRPSLR